MSHAQQAPARVSAKKCHAELSQPYVPGVTKGLKQGGNRDVEHGETGGHHKGVDSIGHKAQSRGRRKERFNTVWSLEE